MADDESAIQEAMKRPISDQVQHKHWKVRENGFTQLSSQFAQVLHLSDENAVRELIGKYASLIPKFIRDANAAAQLAGLQCAVSLANMAGNDIIQRETGRLHTSPNNSVEMSSLLPYGQDLTKIAQEIGAAIVDKVLNARPANKQKATDVIQEFVFAECADMILEPIYSQGLTSKQPKVVEAAANLLKDTIVQFGTQPFKPAVLKSMLSQIATVLDHSSGAVRDQAKLIVLELYKHIPVDVINASLKEVKEVTRKDIAALWEKNQKQLNSEQHDALIRTTALVQARAQGLAPNDSSTSNDPTCERDGQTAAQGNGSIDAFDLMPEIDLFAILDKQSIPVDDDSAKLNWKAALEHAKWSARKACLDAIVTSCENSKLQVDSDYSELVKTLSRIITKDNNVNVAAAASNCVASLSGSLRSNLDKPLAVSLFAALINRLKDKNKVLLVAITVAMDALHLHRTISVPDVFVDHLVPLANSSAKNPQIREKLGDWVANSLARSTTLDELTVYHKKLVDLGLTFVDDSAQSVRETGFLMIALIHLKLGEALIGPLVKCLDAVKMAKLQTMIQENRDRIVPETKQRVAAKMASAPATVLAAVARPTESNTKPDTCGATSKLALENNANKTNTNKPEPIADKSHANAQGPSMNPVIAGTASKMVAPSRKPLSSKGVASAESLISPSKLTEPSTTVSETSKRPLPESKLTGVKPVVIPNRELVGESNPADVADEKKSSSSVSSLIPVKVLSEIKDKDWKIRKQAMDKLYTGLDQLLKFDSDDPMLTCLEMSFFSGVSDVLCETLVDPQKSISCIAYQALGCLAALIMSVRNDSSGIAILKRAFRFVFRNVASEGRQVVQDSAVLCLNQAIDFGFDLSLLVRDLSLALKAENHSVRKLLLDWFVPSVRRNSNMKLPLDDAAMIAESLYACFRDRMVDIRKLSEEAIFELAMILDLDVFQRASQTLSLSYRNDILVLLDRVNTRIRQLKKAIPELPSTSKLTPPRSSIREVTDQRIQVQGGHAKFGPTNNEQLANRSIIRSASNSMRSSPLANRNHRISVQMTNPWAASEGTVINSSAKANGSANPMSDLRETESMSESLQSPPASRLKSPIASIGMISRGVAQSDKNEFTKFASPDTNLKFKMEECTAMQTPELVRQEKPSWQDFEAPTPQLVCQPRLLPSELDAVLAKLLSNVHDQQQLDAVKSLCTLIQTNESLFISQSPKVLGTLIQLLSCDLNAMIHDVHAMENMSPATNQQQLPVETSSDGIRKSIKYLLNALMQIISRPLVASSVDLQTLKLMLKTLLPELESKRVELIPDDGKQILIAINLMVIKILENSDHTLLFTCMISLIGDSVTEMNAKAPLDSSVAGDPEKGLEMIIKCLLKFLKVGFADSSAEIVLRDIHLFFLTHPPSGTKHGMALAMKGIKATLSALVKLHGEKIKSFLTQVPVDTVPAPLVVTYLELMLSNANDGASPAIITVTKPSLNEDVSSHSTATATVPSSKVVTEPSMTETPARLKESIPEDTSVSRYKRMESATPASRAIPVHTSSHQELTELSLIFCRIGAKSSSLQGIQDLYHFRRRHPDFDLDSRLAKASIAFQEFVRSGLNACEQADANISESRNKDSLSSSHGENRDVSLRDIILSMDESRASPMEAFDEQLKKAKASHPLISTGKAAESGDPALSDNALDSTKAIGSFPGADVVMTKTTSTSATTSLAATLASTHSQGTSTASRPLSTAALLREKYEQLRKLEAAAQAKGIATVIDASQAESQLAA